MTPDKIMNGGLIGLILTLILQFSNHNGKLLEKPDPLTAGAGGLSLAAAALGFLGRKNGGSVLAPDTTVPDQPQVGLSVKDILDALKKLRPVDPTPSPGPVPGPTPAPGPVIPGLDDFKGLLDKLMQTKEMIKAFQTKGMPTKMVLTATFSDGSVHTVNYGVDAVPVPTPQS